jgi:Zn-dependent alcohol dehydrogenase
MWFGLLLQVAKAASIAGATRIIGVDINPSKFDQGLL